MKNDYDPVEQHVPEERTSPTELAWLPRSPPRPSVPVHAPGRTYARVECYGVSHHPHSDKDGPLSDL